MSTRVAINGVGRIGRAFIKMAEENSELEVVAINDLGSHENIAYLLNYDTVYGKSGLDATVLDNGNITLQGREVTFLSEKDPTQLPWSDLDIDVVVEATGAFTDYAAANAHREAGAKRVVISAPANGDPAAGVESATILMGVNHDQLKTCQVSSNGSCTTNAGAGVMAALEAGVGIEKAMLTTVHAYTATQLIVDGPVRGSDLRKGRAAAQNIIPTSTGAAVATTEAITSLKGKFDGIAMRVPVPAGSVADITFISKRDTTAEEINQILKDAAADSAYMNVFRVSEDQIVSSDIVGEEYAGIVDAPMTRVVDGNLVKVLSWYDNEVGYTSALIKHVVETGKHA